MPFLKILLSRFVVGLSLRPVGALLLTMLPARGYQGSFLGVLPHSERSELQSAGSRWGCDPRDPYDGAVNGHQRPRIPFARRDFRVRKDVLDLCAPRSAHTITRSSAANSDAIPIDKGDLRTSVEFHNKREAPSMPVRGAPGLEGDRPVS